MPATFIPTSEAEKVPWFKNYVAKLSVYGPGYGITAAEITAAEADKDFLVYIFDENTRLKGESAKMTAYKNTLIDGDIGTPLGALPVAGTPATPPTGVPVAGIFKRASKVIKRIKNHPNYTVASGEDMGIEAHASVSNGLKPFITITLEAGHPVLKWTKGTNDALDIYVDRGDGNFVFLTTALSNKYTDTHTIPPASNSAIWKYIAIFKHGDRQVGEYSDVVSITVSSHVGS